MDQFTRIENQLDRLTAMVSQNGILVAKLEERVVALKEVVDPLASICSRVESLEKSKASFYKIIVGCMVAAIGSAVSVYFAGK